MSEIRLDSLQDCLKKAGDNISVDYQEEVLPDISVRVAWDADEDPNSPRCSIWVEIINPDGEMPPTYLRDMGDTETRIAEEIEHLYALYGYVPPRQYEYREMISTDQIWSFVGAFDTKGRI